MISFVVLNWNSGSFLTRCLDLVTAQTGDWELIAVDNASTNGSADLLDRYATNARVQVLRLERNIGFAGGMNAGAARAHGDVLVLLNSDVSLAPDFVPAIAAIAARERALRSSAGLIAVPVYVWNWDHAIGRDQRTNRLHTVGVSLVKRLSVSTWHPDIDEPDQLLGPEGSCIVILREAAQAASAQLGELFDQRYESYGEDIDLYVRLAALGFSCTWTATTWVWHIGSASVGGHVRYERKPLRFQLMAQINRLRTYAKLSVPRKQWRLLPWILLDDLYRVAQLRDRALLKSFLSAYRQVGSLPKSGRYPPHDLRFAGAIFSRSARILRRHGALPALRDGVAPLP